MTGSEGIANAVDLEAADSTADRTTGGITATAITRNEAWTLFAYLATWSYLLYGIGNATPYLKTDLHLSDFEAGLHGSALAVGVLAVGFVFDSIARRFGSRWFLDFSVGGFVVGVALFALAPMVGFSLAGAAVLGISGSFLGTTVNIGLTKGDPNTSRRLISQANALCMITAGVAPVVIGLAVQVVGVWRIAMFVPAVAALILTVVRRRPPPESEESEEAESARVPRGGLPRVFWLVWLMLLCSFSIEFSQVFWGSTIIARQAGIVTADATLLASFFVVGMFVSRAALGAGLGSSRPRLIIAIGLVIVIVGTSLVWISRTPALSALGIFLGGLGTGVLFPIGLVIALEAAGRGKYQAAARTTMGSGLAVLLAPSLLGLASDAVGVSTAWLAVPGLAVAAMAVLAITPRPKG